jgi:hypothetical protein
MNGIYSITDIFRQFIIEDADFRKFHFKDIETSFERLKRTNPKDTDLSKYEQLIRKNFLPDHSINSYSKYKLPNHEQFFRSTMDETRQYYADEFSEYILFRNDMLDASYFRNIISRKELAREVDYDKHRDHAAHTLNNYLLGWYFYKNCKPVSDEFNNKIAYLKKSLPVNFNEIEYFSHTWVMASLMHDIGYLFEGIIPALSSEPYGDFLRRSAGVVQNFIFHRFWFDTKLDLVYIDHILNSILKFQYEDFNSARTMIQLGDKLATIPDVDQIKNASPYVKQKLNERLKYSDSFEMWRMFSEKIFCLPADQKRTRRMEKLKEAYYELMYKGMGDTGSRIIDHGVASGLLLLLYHSFFYTIYFQLKCHDQELLEKADKDDLDDFNELKNYVLNKLPFEHFKYSPDWYFSGILWATSATALHNIQQTEPDIWFGDIEINGRLSMQEDPLAYLGIMVDLLQEWDRSRVYPSKRFVGKLPLQSHEVDVIQKNFTDEDILKAFNHPHNKKPNHYQRPVIGLVYPKTEQAKQVAEDLRKSLISSWQYVLVFDRSYLDERK